MFFVLPSVTENLKQQTQRMSLLSNYLHETQTFLALSVTS